MRGGISLGGIGGGGFPIGQSVRVSMHVWARRLIGAGSGRAREDSSGDGVRGERRNCRKRSARIDWMR